MAANGVPFPLINGVRHSWASIEIRVAGNIVLGVTELNYSPSLEPGEVRAAGSRVIALTQGSGSSEADMTMLLEEFNQLVGSLGDGWMLVPFDIIASYDESGSGLTTIVDTIQGVRITKVEASNSSGSTDASMRKLTLKPIGILMNGLDPLPPQPTISA